MNEQLRQALVARIEEEGGEWRVGFNDLRLWLTEHRGTPEQFCYLIQRSLIRDIEYGDINIFRLVKP